MAGTIIGETKSEGQGQKTHNLQKPKKWEKDNSSLGRKQSHLRPF
jgi:hypothetical protein